MKKKERTTTNEEMKHILKYEQGLMNNALRHAKQSNSCLASKVLTQELSYIRDWKKTVTTDDAVLAQRYECYPQCVEYKGKEMVSEHIVLYERSRGSYFKEICKCSSNPISKLHMLDKIGIGLESLSTLYFVNWDVLISNIGDIKDVEFDRDTLWLLPEHNKLSSVLLCAANLGGDSVELDLNWVTVWWGE